ncbi:MAG TPA: Uma2 family endonuclease [Gemmatimonadaceae bacterium]|nr:Uma2 family endonuclease [Gemmatimonadaceae bacterium]
MPNLRSRKWTLEQMHALPEDGNRYELVHGELLVTPAPSPEHQGLVDALAAVLFPYVSRHRLGVVQFPRSVIRVDGSETEPDLMVRPGPLVPGMRWEDAPLPILAVEVISPGSRRGDLVTKRGFYLELGIPEYWIVDGEARLIRVARPDRVDTLAERDLHWNPRGTAEALRIDVMALFAEALGPAS